MKPIRIGSASRIEIGYDGENGARAVVFDATKWMEEMPGCTAAITAQRADGKEYIAPDVKQDEAEKTITWTLTSAETMEGEGRAQLLWMDGERIAKQAIFTTICHESLKSDATEIGVPEPVWAQKSLAAARKAEADAGRAEAAAARAEAAEEAVYAPSASAERVEGGVLVTVTDKTGTTSAVIRDGERGETGPQGEQGPKGEQGPQGIQGPAGADGKETVIDATLTQAGQAADAAKTGEDIGKLKNDLTKIENAFGNDTYEDLHLDVIMGAYARKENGVIVADSSNVMGYVEKAVTSGEKYYITSTILSNCALVFYNGDAYVSDINSIGSVTDYEVTIPSGVTMMRVSNRYASTTDTIIKGKCISYEPFKKEVDTLKIDLGGIILKETSQNIFDEAWEVGGINSLGKDNNSQTSNKRTGFIDADISNGLGVWRENSAPCLFQIFSYSENGAFLGSRRFFEANDTNNFAFRDSSFAGFYVGTKKIRLVTDNLSIGKVQVQYSSTFTKYMQMGETENDGVNPTAVKNISLSAQTNDCGFITAFATDELNDRMFAMETRTGFKWRPFDCGKVVFMTDDTLSDIGVITSLLMNTYAFPMSYACITNTLENDVDANDNGYKKVKDVLLASQSFGGEVFSHSINSDDWGANKATNGGYDGTVPAEESERRLRKSKETLRSYGIKCNGFISPRGSDLNGYAEQLAKYFRYAYYQGADIPQIYHFLRKNIKGMTLADLKAEIDKCAKDKSLLVLMCHSVVDTNGEGYGFYPNGFTLDDLTAIMDYLKWGNDTTKTTERTDIEVTSMKAVYNAFASI